MSVMMKLIRKIYDWTLRISAHRHATWGLAGVSFVESSFFPIPPDVILIPMCISNRSKAFWYATICTLASVAGGLLGYGIGYFLYESIGSSIIEFYGMGGKFSELQSRYAEWGGWIIFAKGLTPFPYKVITILSGVLSLSIPVFIVASILSRSLRFFLVAALIWKYGAPIQSFIERRLGLVTLLFLVLLIGGFALLRYV
jgi:membrane protein YqaA with SNARE-associated domain